MSKSGLSYKMTLLGDSGVGKTSLFKKLFTGKFDPRIISTIGVDKRSLNISINTDEGEKDVDISLFDTAGQERFRSITKNYIKGADGVILIYDITNRQSFEHVQNWLDNIIEILSDWKTQNYLIVLIGNKLDLVKDDDNLNDEEKKRKVTTEEGENKCKDSGIQWGGECSAMEFTLEQMKDLFGKFVIQIFSKVGVKETQQHVEKIQTHKKKKRKCFL